MNADDLARRLVRSGITDAPTVERMLQAVYDHDPPARRDEFASLAAWAAASGNAGRERERTARNNGAQRQGARDRIIDMTAAMATAGDPLPYRVRPLAIDGYVTLLVGRRGDAKTWLGLLACNAVANGADLMPLSCTNGPALLLDAESGPRLLARRFVLLGLGGDAFTVADGMGLRLPQDIDQVRALVDSTGARLVVLDSLRRLTPGAREDKSDDAVPIMESLSVLSRETDAAIVVLHNRSTKPNAPDVRGSSALEDQADVVWVLERLKADPERRTRRRLRCTKMRPDIEPPPLWLDFKTVAGFMTLAAAEPFAGTRDEADSEAAPETAWEVMTDRIRALADQVRRDGDWPPKQLAAAVGSTPDHGTFRAALGALLEAGEWVAAGQTRARRVRPADSGNSGIPLGDCPNARIEMTLDDVATEAQQALYDRNLDLYDGDDGPMR